MPDIVDRFWRHVPRGSAPYPERTHAIEGRRDRALLAAAARLRRLLRHGQSTGQAICHAVDSRQATADGLSDDALRDEAGRLRTLLRRDGFESGLVAWCFALIRTAADRRIAMRHYPVQLLGGEAMLRGELAEMETGEGKTLTATLPAATAALAGLPVHVITVNDYLARRDAEAMRPVYEALGLSVGFTQPGQASFDRRAAYAADICYCTNKDIGFDYLRDRLALGARRGRGHLSLQQLLGSKGSSDELLLRGLHFAIVDEADSVLIDEARTPLIISAGEDSRSNAELYVAALGIAQSLQTDTDFSVDTLDRGASLTDAGREKVAERRDALPPLWRTERAREELVQQALAALHLFARDKQYLVRDGKIQIIDEFTGRLMPDRSWERGLQQLLETKEGCDITSQRVTLARITYQRLFRRYLRLCGMSGTAMEVAPELDAVYGLKVRRIPTNRPTRRESRGIRMYPTRSLKWDAVLEIVSNTTAKGRPVLIGTRSVAESEHLSALLSARGLEHVVLNARQDGEEAQIVAKAGEARRVTVATNMAGRGTDIALGSEVQARGGLHVVLTEFHESARIDRQLFGRCGRQGDPGSFEAVVSGEDDIFRIHASSTSKFFGSLFGGSRRPYPARAAAMIRAVAQYSAEWTNAQDRQATMETDRRLDAAMAFTGRTE